MSEGDAAMDEVCESGAVVQAVRGPSGHGGEFASAPGTILLWAEQPGEDLHCLVERSHRRLGHHTSQYACPAEPVAQGHGLLLAGMQGDV
ncbi:hypothetical protein CAG99_14655 [Streptomyces marincola]|uniref:Uncharacterized protein n=1 Tax=Streptomyces marincola TaxID=2878388 RepID=A0A1W7CYR8_9ACTN|nr:hypothetical protein CAG99_14655 [Streptomyces marincola]